MHHLITGAAGFIGSHLTSRLLANGNKVSALDDFSLGRRDHLAHLSGNSAFQLWEVDLRDGTTTNTVFNEAVAWGGIPDIVWHLAANSDIPAGVANREVDFGRTFLTSKCVLDAMNHVGAKKLAFASTSAVYGEHPDLLTETTGPLLPTSNYGAAKLAAEAFISAASEVSLDRSWIFRFPNVVGRHATHGVIYDLIHRLLAQPASLKVLGDGTQAKPYLHVSELVDAITFIVEHAHDRRNVFNIGPGSESTTVRFIAETVIAKVCGETPIPIAYTGGDRGWAGDVPKFQFSTDRLAELGWTPKLNSDQAIVKAVAEIADEIMTAARNEG
jgi:UDP-glucose 4-epimerase